MKGFPETDSTMLLVNLKISICMYSFENNTKKLGDEFV